MNSNAPNWQGLHVVVTAGPTWEPIDPVRGITNRSSGKMGYAIAETSSNAGAKVTLISGPVCIPAPDNVERICVESAQEMHDQVHEVIADCHIFIAVAAVADYRVAEQSEHKMKKSADTDELTLSLVKTPDILASVGHLEANRPFTVGFAAETQNVIEYARRKVFSKNADLIAANDVSSNESGFGTDNNHLIVVSPDQQFDLGQSDKKTLAKKLLNLIDKTRIAQHS